jgi:hypothetical protein
MMPDGPIQVFHLPFQVKHGQGGKPFGTITTLSSPSKGNKQS